MKPSWLRQLPLCATAEQRERLKKIAFWRGLPFPALREQCWNLGLRSAYFNSADAKGCEKLVLEAAWCQRPAQ